MIPPLLIYVRIGRVPLPLPVLLLWPLLLVLLVGGTVVLPFVRLPGTTVGGRARTPFVFYRMLAATRGLSVDVRSADGHAVRFCCW